MKQPIDNITWLDASLVAANDYNPNVVLDQELKLLKFSLLRQGWIQPVLVADDPAHEGYYTIIDGFHRHYLCSTDKEVAAMTNGQVPCAILKLDEAERKMLTIRINRAKGNHVAFKMHDIVSSLYHEHGMSKEDIAQGIGANKHEIDLLLQEGVFSAKNIKEHKYSKAWVPVAKKD